LKLKSFGFIHQKAPPNKKVKFCKTRSKDSDKLITDLGDALPIKDIRPIHSDRDQRLKENPKQALSSV
jgi:hypothetical protein